MVKFLGYCSLIVFSLIYLISSSTELTIDITQKKIESNSIVGSDKSRFGDLFGLSYLPAYQEIQTDSLQRHLLFSECNLKRTIDLYALWDSYLYGFEDKRFYCGVDSIISAKTNSRSKLYVSLDTQKTNILLFEIAERHVRETFANTSYIRRLVQPSANQKPQDNDGFSYYHKKLVGFLFNKKINTNLESNLWDYSVFTPIKKLKADINFKLFNVTDNTVVVSPDNKQLFYKETVDTTEISSSFQHVPDMEIRDIVSKLNGVYDSAKSLGFKKICLTIIPNPVSVLYPSYKGRKYNQLITRIQNSPELKMTVIDIYSTFRNARMPVYHTADSHWNTQGQSLWFKKFNDILLKEATN